MQSRLKSLAISDFGRIFAQGTAPANDSTLLRRFVERGEETAFEALIARHGPMVRGVCRRLLVDPHDADDAFQATFLVLIRKAKGLRDADRLGPWLYGVATRVATKARSQGARRRDRQGGCADEVGSLDDPAPDWIDVRPILDDELGRLSPKLRDVLVLCLLEGVTAEEASFRLSCPLGTVKSRLARGREALRHRLIRRGVAPSVAVVAASSVFASPVSASLVRTTLGLTSVASTAMPTALVTLTRGVATAMIARSTIVTSLVLGSVIVAGLGTASWLRSDAVAQSDATAGRSSGGKMPSRETKATKENVDQILHAFQNHVDTTQDQFPPVAIYGSDGLPKLSWRVALLPYLNEPELYEAFKQDEPWDSPHNIKLLARMPAVFKTPIAPAPVTETRIRGFQGKGAMFDGVKGIRLAEITDGTSNTAIIAVAKDSVPWTKPDEIPFAKGLTTDFLHEGEFGLMLGMADGQVRFTRKNNGHLLGNMITAAGGEVFSMTGPQYSTSKVVPILQPTPNQGGRAAMFMSPTPANGMAMPGMQPGGGGTVPEGAMGMPGMMPGGGATPEGAMMGMGMGGGMMPGMRDTVAKAKGARMGGMPGGMPGMGMMGMDGSPPASMEERLKNMEAKLDLIMKKLEITPEGVLKR